MSDHFYTSIASQYQKIFPFNPDQIEFLKYVLPYNGARVLDVGCACGDLSFALTHFGFPTWGFDLDSQMIEIAKDAKQEDAMFPVFEQLDMRTIVERYPESYFNTVICFGNTLVHLLSDEDIMQFINGAFQLLAPQGKLTIQLLNYQNILDNQIKALPLIDNDQIRFERNYEFATNSNLIDFNTRLTVKSTGQEIKNEIKLFAITKTQIEQLLTMAGFNSLEFHGSFKRDALTPNSMPLIVTAQKP
jgi:glycine/sarcosine N-methyltransferase